MKKIVGAAAITLMVSLACADTLFCQSQQSSKTINIIENQSRGYATMIFSDGGQTSVTLTQKKVPAALRRSPLGFELHKKYFGYYFELNIVSYGDDTFNPSPTLFSGYLTSGSNGEAYNCRSIEK